MNSQSCFEVSKSDVQISISKDSMKMENQELFQNPKSEKYLKAESQISNL